MGLFEDLSEKIVDKGIRIVFPEGTDPRVLGAAIRLRGADLVNPILMGNPDEIEALAKERHYLIDGIEIIDPDNYEHMEEMAQAHFERRAGKTTIEQSREAVKDAPTLGTMLVYTGKADGMVCGAVYSTGHTVRPALQIIKTKPGIKLTSGAFLMIPPQRDGQLFIFGDVAININPDAEALAEIAIQCAETAELFGIDPKVAMLSFSTHGSAKSPEVDKVVEATRIAKEKAPNLCLDGELQFDAAYSKGVGIKKAPGSPVAGYATVYVFPEIQSGNIGSKIAQRMGNYQAVGPVLQGLNKPIADLSRGCLEEDVFKLGIITAMQALNIKQVD